MPTTRNRPRNIHQLANDFWFIVHPDFCPLEEKGPGEEQSDGIVLSTQLPVSK